MSRNSYTQLYSVGTWDTDAQGYTPQPELDRESFNITLWQLKELLQILKKEFGYSCHRYRDDDGGHECNDWSVLVERTDGKPQSEILESWKR